jgi:NAD-dependent dihydropyrimidine dehydrogenase PreA subunit
MTYVIAEPCIGVKDASCVDVCPVDCIHATDEDPMFYIDPDECIDCGACEPECPTTAIFEESALPDKWKAFIDINSVFSGAKAPSDADTEGWPQHIVDHVQSSAFQAWPGITATKPALPDADALQTVEDKFKDMSPKGGG